MVLVGAAEAPRLQPQALQGSRRGEVQPEGLLAELPRTLQGSQQVLLTRSLSLSCSRARARALSLPLYTHARAHTHTHTIHISFRHDQPTHPPT